MASSVVGLRFKRDRGVPAATLRRALLRRTRLTSFSSHRLVHAPAEKKGDKKEKDKKKDKPEETAEERAARKAKKEAKKAAEDAKRARDPRLAAPPRAALLPF